MFAKSLIKFVAGILQLVVDHHRIRGLGADALAFLLPILREHTDACADVYSLVIQTHTEKDGHCAVFVDSPASQAEGRIELVYHIV